MKSWLSVIDKMSEWSGKIFSFLALISTILITAEVIMRYAFNSPTIWSLELTIFMCGTMYLMGGAFAHLYDAHIKVDALYMRWTRRVKAIVDLVTSPIFFISVGMLVWIGAQWTIESYVGHETSGEMWSPIIWPMRLFVPLGSLLLFLQGLAKFVRDFGIASKGRSA